METKINTWADLKQFTSTLNDEQLLQPVSISESDRPLKKIDSVEVLECDHINPSGEMAEPITDYLPGGQHYDPDFDPAEDGIVASTGFVFLVIEE